MNCKELKFKIKELKNEVKENYDEIDKLRKDYELLKIKINNNSNYNINDYNKDNYLKYIFEEIMSDNFPNLKDRSQDTGGTEGPKQIEPKQAHINTYYNRNCKS